jgi:3-hydroxyisobutyrate dehydrogenase
MRKDFNLAVEMAEKVGARLQLGQAALKTYAEASQDPRSQDLVLKSCLPIHRWR